MTTATARQKTAAGKAPQVDAIAANLCILVDPGEVVELRVCEYTTDPEGKWATTYYGYFDYAHLGAMAEHAWRLSQHAVGTYVTLNPTKPEMISRVCNRVKIGKKDHSTGDQHILFRKWLLVDADPVRPVSDIPSTDDEKEYAWDMVRGVRQYLRTQGWADPILADSGNGYHALFRINLPVDDGGLVEHILKALAQRFDNEHCTIDQKVFNASRITKLYGSVPHKGDHTPERPHRQSKILEVP